MSNCMMLKTREIAKIYSYVGLTYTSNTWGKRFIMIVMILLNCVGCVVTWVTCVRGLPGSVSEWVVWVKFLRGLPRLRGSKYLLRGSWCLRGLRGSKFFVWIQIFLRGSLRGSKFFTWVQNFFVGQLLFTRRDHFTILQLIT